MSGSDKADESMVEVGLAPEGSQFDAHLYDSTLKRWWFTKWGRDYGVKAECTVHGSLAYAGKVKRINIVKHLDMEREARHQCILHELHCIKQHRYTMVCEHIRENPYAPMSLARIETDADTACCYITLAHKLQLVVIFIDDIDSFLGYQRATNCEALTNMKKRVPWLATLQVTGISGYCGTVNLLMSSKVFCVVTGLFDTFMDAGTLFPMVVRSFLLLDVEMVERVVRLQFCSHAS
ncbi:hypothetical protein C5167_022695 [Papaver somniferum]|uniref:Uncharacterized protein n=1 Tax=Papaver somniferum TaxID=3469 RepID=A0A4Y7JK74_PAPSO|nr:hypothetical protein C5167_022695 [Papaver somniferum]